MSADNTYIILEESGKRIVLTIRPEDNNNGWYWACDNRYVDPHESPTGWGRSVTKAVMDYLVSIKVLSLEKAAKDNL